MLTVIWEESVYQRTARSSGWCLVVILLAAVALPGGALIAQEATQPAYDRLWAKTELYSGAEDSFFQSFGLSGRLQLDLAYVDSGEESHGEFNVRRFRFGFKTDFLRSWTLHVEGEFNPQERDPTYTRLTDTYLAWRSSDAFGLIAGKHSAGFTLDGMTSSKSLLTIDRSNVTNNIWFTEEYIPGISAKGENGGWSYFVGIFTSDSADPEFGDFKGGEFELLTLGYDFAAQLGVNEALWRVNLVHNDPDPENTLSRQLEWVASTSFAMEGERWGFRADISAARGFGEQSDLAGIVVMPFYDKSEALQFVARYTFVDSADPNGVRFARYEREIVDGRGDRFNEIYLGLNYYWYGHKLKWQNGLQYADMRDQAEDGGDYSGWGMTTAFRLSW